MRIIIKAYLIIRLIKHDSSQVKTIGLPTNLLCVTPRKLWSVTIIMQHIVQYTYLISRTGRYFSHFHQQLAGSCVYINGDRVLFLREKSGRSLKLKTHVNKEITWSVLESFTSIMLLFILLCFGTRTFSLSICNPSMHNANYVLTYSTIYFDV